MTPLGKHESKHLVIAVPNVIDVTNTLGTPLTKTLGTPIHTLVTPLILLLEQIHHAWSLFGSLAWFTVSDCYGPVFD